MPMRSRHLITAGCLLIALVLYAAGAKSGAALVLLGAAFELAFWVRLARSRRQS
jgi:Flp pilus assembly protein TadB